MNERPCRRFRFFFPILLLVVIAAATGVVFGLWNSVLVAVLGVKTITFWQALGLLVLSKILFGGFPGRGGPPFRARRMAMAHWHSLSPEERERIRHDFDARCGFDCGGPSDPSRDNPTSA